ncbi:hypothetical protein PACTADRAFT_74900 [Pachysolen tannophilus NRRL Y-2460]|uniref:proline--tRNA ligase n=1 Tax=Pachysolen tannophilus NRRL Y-2460 TaxID=669874 RepID=A0A1E4U054_PACTA|nr:hypothetical protein PACTADRAFT_74900 [Pachysolen tannophilus NRRL Y-2460]
MLRVSKVPRPCSWGLEGFKKLNSKVISELPTHELLQKLGYIKQPNAGLVHWLPLGLSVLRSIENIIHKRMREIDGIEVSLSTLSNSDVWKKTGRWNNNELFKLKDSKQNDYCLVPTCEEEITAIINNQINSYKNLPLMVYQITRKYRDEKRPRAGLLRGREFIMKDAYSFHKDEEDALFFFEKVNEAYKKIFSDLKIPFTSAKADSGDIGGNLSLEWHYIHNTGEDTLLVCDECNTVSNVEVALSFPQEDTKLADEAKVKYYLTKDNNTLVCLYYPAGRTLVPNFVSEQVPDVDFTKTNEDEIISKFLEDEESFLTKQIVRVMDCRLHDRSNFPDMKVPYHRGSFSTLTDIPLVEAQEGEICGKCENGTLKAHKSIEVGHTFYLGDRYSKSMNAQFIDEDGISKKFLMGCYGIGVSRLIAAIAEVTRDEIGLNWPAVIAPYHITVIHAPGERINQFDLIFQELKNQGFKIEEDVRDLTNISVGKKLKESKMLGIPLQIIVGKLFPKIEIEVRGKRYITKELEIEKLFKEKEKQYQWEIIKDINNKDCPEKHIVHIDGLVDVIKSLLKDL